MLTDLRAIIFTLECNNRQTVYSCIEISVLATVLTPKIKPASNISSLYDIFLKFTKYSVLNGLSILYKYYFFKKIF